jgi:protein-S-isoprenylcysteine O-methyltransferase Ste14
VGSIGTALLGAAIWLFWRSHRDLGKNWSPSLEISAQQTLITHGVYRTIRHPMYARQANDTHKRNYYAISILLI